MKTMSERYRLIMQLFQSRDYVSTMLFLVALAMLVMWVVVETSPFLAARRPMWRSVYWIATLGTYVLGLVFMAVKL
jgi:hypothetical protein